MANVTNKQLLERLQKVEANVDNLEELLVLARTEFDEEIDRLDGNINEVQDELNPVEHTMSRGKLEEFYYPRETRPSYTPFVVPFFLGILCAVLIRR